MSRGWVSLLLVAVLGIGACRPSHESMSSGQIGCNPSRISISDETTEVGLGQSSETWVAECDGKRFYCSRVTAGDAGVQVACKEEAEQGVTSSPAAGAVAPTIERSPAPTGAAGFTLGAPVAHEQGVCEGAGQQWQLVGAQYSCSGSASPLGFDASVTLRICTERVCSISLSHRPSSDWMAFVGDLKDKLEAKYGPPSEADDLVPADCRGEKAFAACLDAGKLRLRFGWSWPTSERVALIVGQLNQAKSASVLIEYSKRVDSAL